MKQLIVALIGETGSGKSTFAAMCTEEDVHSIIAGVIGKKGTTKGTNKFSYCIKNEEYEINSESSKKVFQEDYANGKKEFLLPLSPHIKLDFFDTLILLDTQGINDWKTELDKKNVYDDIVKACSEADIIFVMIPEGGSVVTTNEILSKVFNEYCHKPIVFVYKSQQSRKELLQYEKALSFLKDDVNINLNNYGKKYSKLTDVITKVETPSTDIPLLCILPNSEELSSDIPPENRLCNNRILKDCIREILEYAIGLQKSLIDVMSSEYVQENQREISDAVNELKSIDLIATNTKSIRDSMITPYVKDLRSHKFNNYFSTDIEYSWQGGTRGEYPVAGGDYTYFANNIYEIIKRMIESLKTVSVGTKSSLLSVLNSISQDRLAPGTLNLPFIISIRGVPVDWLLDLRTEIFNKYPNLFRKVTKEDFNTEPQYKYFLRTNEEFKNQHGDWDKYLGNIIYTSDDRRRKIRSYFNNDESNATVLIHSILSCITNKIDFVKNMKIKLKNEFLDTAFNEDGECKIFK